MRVPNSFILIGVVSAGAVAAAPALAQSSPVLEVSAAVQHDVSPALRELPDRPGLERKRDRPLRSIFVPPGQEQPDPVLQIQSGPLVGTAAGLGFAGVGNGDYGFAPNSAPPDTNMAVGLTQVVQWVNESFAVFSKTGALLKGPTAGNTLWAGFGGACETNNDGDPIVQ